MTTARRPSWQHEPCPPWCVVEHREEDLPDDRVHDSKGACLTVSTPDPSTPSQTRPLELTLVRYRHLDEHEDWLHLTIGEGEHPGLTLSPEGARALSRTLLAEATN